MIRYLLLHRIDWTDRHPHLMTALSLITICIALAFSNEVTP